MAPLGRSAGRRRLELVDLGLLPGYTSAEATGVSGDGSVVVGTVRGASQSAHTFRWTAATGMVDVTVGAGTHEAYGISADGSTIVGRAFFPNPSRYEAFRISTTGGTQYLATTPSEAYAVSADSSVVVGTTGRAFRWTAATGMVDLGQLPLAGVSYIQATGVSADGSMVVGVCQATGGIRSFLWTAAFGMVDLGPAPGGPDFETRGVSADGATIVGDVAGSPGGPRAIRWTFSDGPHDFQNDLTTNYALGSQLVGWTLTHAFACSADGRIVVGDGTDPAGKQEGWIARLDSTFHPTGTQVNDGAAQRSRVTSLSVSFSTQVTFAGTVENAFTLTRTGGGSVSFSASASVVNGVTVVTLNNFTGTDTQFGSLADGRYTLTALASQISANGQQLDGNGDGTTGDNYTFNDTQGLFRLFGDVNGDQTVNGLDLGLFRNAFGTQTGDSNYLRYLDLNGDGVINGFDLGQFRARFGTVLP